MRQLLGLGGALALLASASPAAGYVRSRTSSNTAIAWPGSCVFIQPDSPPSTTDLAADEIYSAIQRSMGNWAPASACGYLQLKYVTPSGALEAHYDGKNTVKFRTDTWCHPEDDQDHNQCYDARAAAITTVFYVNHVGQSDDGRVIDTDIELNDINFTFVVEPSSSTPRPQTTTANLENTLTHELGHVQGLDHTCKDAATPANEVDENGSAPPACTELARLPPAEQTKIVTATMFNQAGPGEITKRSPEADDVAGICAAYPAAHDPQVCTPSSLPGKSCSFAGVGAPGGPAVLLVLVLFAACRPRRTSVNRG